jgi:hypothetical protein
MRARFSDRWQELHHVRAHARDSVPDCVAGDTGPAAGTWVLGPHIDDAIRYWPGGSPVLPTGRLPAAHNLKHTSNKKRNRQDAGPGDTHRATILPHTTARDEQSTTSCGANCYTRLVRTVQAGP